MASTVTRPAWWLPPYSGTLGVRLRRACLRLSAFVLLLAMGFATGGCALSYKLDSMLGNRTAAQKEETTGSVAEGPFAASSMAELFESDLVYARAAASEVLSRGNKDTSMPWENPKTGARGTVTPIAAAYNQDGAICRDFVASYLRGGEQAWLQGEGCRTDGGSWEVTSLKPLKHS